MGHAVPLHVSAKEPRGSFPPGDRVEDEPGTVPYAAARRDERISGCLPPVNFLKFEEIAVRRRPWRAWMSVTSPAAVEDAGGSREEQGLSRAKSFSQ